MATETPAGKPKYWSEAQLEQANHDQIGTYMDSLGAYTEVLRDAGYDTLNIADPDGSHSPLVKRLLDEYDKASDFEQIKWQEWLEANTEPAGDGLEEHGKFHSDEHMHVMKKAMARGLTFDDAHILAINQVGQGLSFPRLARELSRTQYRVF